MSTDTAVSTKVVTGVVRLSYASIWEARAVEEGKEKKYSTAILIPKTDTVTIDKIKKVVKELTDGVKAKNKGKLPAGFKLPLHDGDEEREEDENYAGHYFLNASSKNKPGIVDKELNEILDKSEVYSGCFVKVALNFYAYDNKSKGVAAGLNNIMKVKDGPALSGGSTAKEDFADVTNDDVDDWG